MICLACWREAERMAKRSGVPQDRVRPEAKKIYLQFHITAAGDTGTENRHIKSGGYRRHKSGKIVRPA